MSLIYPAAAAPLVALDGVGKSYPLRSQNQAMGRLGTVWGHLAGSPRQTTVFHALRGIDLNIIQGQSTGLIGVNGAGKSTLMKLVAGVIAPDEGHLRTRGRVGALLELGAGFHPEYTGRANVHMACSLMGMSPADTAERMDHILAFADIGAHIDQPVKQYSSGMVVRLGFAVATSMRPDLLITDEVLAVGDESFQRKCIQWMENYLGTGGTLLLCSHSMYHIQKLCTHAAWIDAGQVREFGAAGDVTRHYLAWHEEKAGIARQQETPNVTTVVDASLYQIKTMALNGQANGGMIVLPPGSSLTISGTIHSPDGRSPGVAVGLLRADGTPVYGTYSDQEGYRPRQLSAQEFGYAITFADMPLLPGRYVARSHALDPESMRLFDCVERTFEVTGHTREEGFCRLPHVWDADK